MIGSETWINGQQTVKAPQQQSSPYKGNYGEGNFGDYERPL
jgi:hypothetical protein